MNTMPRRHFVMNGSQTAVPFAYSLCAGLCLTCFALLLHPMSPDEFLLLALTAPQATWQDAYGGQATILFWISVAPIVFGVAGLLRSAARSMRRTATPQPNTRREAWLL